MAVTASLCKNLPEYMNTLNSVTEVPGDNYESRVLNSAGKAPGMYIQRLDILPLPIPEILQA